MGIVFVNQKLSDFLNKYHPIPSWELLVLRLTMTFNLTQLDSLTYEEAEPLLESYKEE